MASGNAVPFLSPIAIAGCPVTALPIDPDLFDLLVCPLAQRPLKWTGALLVSTDPGTRRAYRIVDGIPVLLPDAGEELDLQCWQEAMDGPGPVGGGIEALRSRGS